jgi:S1-C subfamily serine protease
LALAALLAFAAPAAAFPWLPWFRYLPVPYPPADPAPRTGVQITAIVPESPAGRAGLEVGDIILRINGIRTRTLWDTALALDDSDYQRTRITVFDQDTRRQKIEYLYPGRGGWIGVTGRSVAKPVRGYAVRVTAVQPSGPAARAGLEPGDVVVRVDDRRVDGPVELGQALRDAGSSVLLTYVDNQTGWTGRTLVQPVAGRIGVNAERVPLASAGRYPY